MTGWKSGRSRNGFRITGSSASIISRRRRGLYPVFLFVTSMIPLIPKSGNADRAVAAIVRTNPVAVRFVHVVVRSAEPLTETYPVTVRNWTPRGEKSTSSFAGGVYGRSRKCVVSGETRATPPMTPT